VDHVIVVDDGSKDNTADVARLAGAEVIRIDENQGKAHALLLGLKRAREFGCRVAVTFDGDGQHKTSTIPFVAQPVLSGKADLVISLRFPGMNLPNYFAKKRAKHFFLNQTKNIELILIVRWLGYCLVNFQVSDKGGVILL